MLDPYYERVGFRRAGKSYVLGVRAVTVNSVVPETTTDPLQPERRARDVGPSLADHPRYVIPVLLVIGIFAS